MSRFKVKDNNDQWVDISANGVGVPSGGNQGQILAKRSGTNYDAGWVNPSGGVHVGPTAPSDAFTTIWLDTDEQGASSVSSVNGKNGTVVLDADDVGAMSEWVLLWENASPSSSFAAQTIQVDSSGYDFLLFEVSAEGYNYTSPFMLVSKKSIVAGNNICIRGIAGYSYFISRAILSITDTSIQFDVATTATSFNTNGSTNNACVIPKYIWGIKGVVAT